VQILNAAPRDAFTVAQITALLQSPALQVDFGCELLDGNDLFLSDISADVVAAGSEVDRSNYATIHGTCKLDISRALQWGRSPGPPVPGTDVADRWPR